MLFNSYLFILFFLPVSLLGYYFFSGKEEKLNKRGMLWLIAVSLWFYGYGNPGNLIVLLLSMMLNYYFCGRILKNIENKARQSFFTVLAAMVQVSILLVYKYTNFFLDLTFEYHRIEERVSWALPLGISFFTFSQLSFLLDTKRGEIEKKVSFMEYAAYVSWFPKLTMGPIMTFSQFLPLLEERDKRKPDYRNLSEGLYIFTMGLAKKVLLADTLAKIVAIGYSDVYWFSTHTALVVTLSYTLQIYFDFSGYCDMAVGVGQMFNLSVPENFNSPYKALSISDFWKRWHMTLTAFFTRYLYIPLGGSKRGRIRTYLNTLIVFLVSGLWHGANLTFVLWGAVHGIFMVLERLGKDIKSHIITKWKKTEGQTGQLWKLLEYGVRPVRWLITFCIINLTWVIFGSKNIKELRAYLRQLFSGGWQLDQRIQELFLDLMEIRLLKRLGLGFFFEQYPVLALWLTIFLLIGCCALLKNRKEKMPVKNFTVKKGVIVLSLLLWCIFSLSDITTFLYFEF